MQKINRREFGIPILLGHEDIISTCDIIYLKQDMGMGQNLLLPYLEESTSINQLF